MPELIITCNRDGSVQKETKGFKGKDCETVTDFIEKALGGRDMQRTRKESFYVQTTEDKRKKPRLLSGLTN